MNMNCIAIYWDARAVQSTREQLSLMQICLYSHNMLKQREDFLIQNEMNTI